MSDLLGDNTQNTAPLEAVYSQFLSRERVSWRDLMHGYTHFRGVTFSSSIPTLLDVVDLFDDAEIIFASERTLSREHAALEAASDVLNHYTFTDALADEAALIPALAEQLGAHGRQLLERVAERSLRFHLMRKTPSHEKLYLLSGPNGSRVITGSANLSTAALAGRQREIFVVYDGDEAHEAFADIIDVDCGVADPVQASDLIAKPSHGDGKSAGTMADGDASQNVQKSPGGDEAPAYKPRTQGVDIEKVPVARALDAGVTIVEEPPPRTNDVPTITAKSLREAYKIGRRLQDLPLQSDKTGRTIITSKHFKRAYRTHRAQPTDDTAEHPPYIEIDLLQQTILLNDDVFYDGTTPPEHEVARDVRLLGNYFDGFQKFRGNIERSVTSFWSLLVWLYVSPFIGALRRQAVVSNASTLSYPLFGTLYGRSDGGKTTFGRIAIRSMFGVEQMMQGKDFTPRKVEGMQSQLKGVPLLCDDISQDRFRRNLAELVKFDYGTTENISGVIITANQDVKAITPDLRKRMIVGKVDIARLPSTSELPMREALNGLGTALYRTFLNRFLPKLVEAREQIAHDPANPPDVLALASQELSSLISEHRENAPWAQPFTLQDMLTLETQPSLDVIHEMMETQPENVSVNRKRGEIHVQFDGDKAQALNFANQMPAWAVKERLADTVRLDMTALERELGFKPKRHGRLLHWFKRASPR